MSTGIYILKPTMYEAMEYSGNNIYEAVQFIGDEYSCLINRKRDMLSVFVAMEDDRGGEHIIDVPAGSCLLKNIANGELMAIDSIVFRNLYELAVPVQTAPLSNKK